MNVYQILKSPGSSIPFFNFENGYQLSNRISRYDLQHGSPLRLLTKKNYANYYLKYSNYQIFQ